MRQVEREEFSGHRFTDSHLCLNVYLDNLELERILLHVLQQIKQTCCTGYYSSFEYENKKYVINCTLAS